MIFSKIKFGKDLINIVKDDEKISYVRDKDMTKLLQTALPFLHKMDQEGTFAISDVLTMKDEKFLQLKAVEILMNYCFEADKAIRLKEQRDGLRRENEFLNSACLRFKKTLESLDQKYSE